MTFLRLFAGCFVQLAPFAYLCFYPFQEHFRLSVQKTTAFTITVLAGCSLLFAGSGTYLASILPGNHALFQAVNIIFTLCLTPCLFWYSYAVRTNWQKKLFIFSFNLTSALSVTSICNAISTWIYLDADSDRLPYKGCTIFLLLAVTVFFLPLLRHLLKQGYLPVEKELTDMEYTMQILEKQYAKINENIENSRRMRHDSRHIFLTVLNLLEQKELNAASEYIKKYLQEIQKYELTKFCENQITNILLSHYHDIAQREDIDFQVRVRMPAHPHVKESDLSIVLGNLLENAVEAAENTPNEQPRYIKVNIVCSQKVFAITVDNSFDGNVYMKKPGYYLSTKSPNRGTGLYSLICMAKKYHGTFQFEHDEKEFRSSLLLDTK